MADAGGEQVYATLLLSDSYLPGALVLAHSLRDAGTTHRLAVLITLDSVSAESVTQLKTVYDYVLPVPRIRNAQPANLYLMDRADLHSAFTKINLWKQTQFSKIVYVDADVVAYRAPDELFSLPHAFSAAPDIGWPDIFNTGVMVLTPNMGDYYAMMAMAERGISFDGADQGLLNMHFKNTFNRLSFTYNVTPSAHYQYVPAYRHFQSSINMVHFIGSNKPWFAGRDVSHGSAPYDEMVGRWWAVYDRHYRVQETLPQEVQTAPEYVQYLTKGEFQPTVARPTSQPATGEHLAGPGDGSVAAIAQPHIPASQHHHPASGSGHEQPAPHGDARPGDSSAHAIFVHSSESVGKSSESPAEARSDQQEPPAKEERSGPTPVTTHSWDAQRHPPPLDSKPEAFNFPSTHYEMSRDSGLFIPPIRYPSPPKNMWFEVPRGPPAPPAHRPNPIFPWEGHQPRASRSFAGDELLALQTGDSSGGPHGERQAAPESGARAEPFPTESSVPRTKDTVSTPTTPTIKIVPSDPWTSFTRMNAWDDVPEIGKYVEGLQKHRRVKSQGSASNLRGGLSSFGVGAGDQGRGKARGFRLTDFPTEVERPSLPVTPAPILRPSFWGEDELGPGQDSATQPLPVAEGVPAQSEWDPVAQLQVLAKQQSEALLRKLGGEEGGAPGSANVDIASPQPTPGKATTGPIRGMGSAGEPVASIPEPSYSGPGTAWEKDEDTLPNPSSLPQGDVPGL